MLQGYVQVVTPLLDLMVRAGKSDGDEEAVGSGVPLYDRDGKRASCVGRYSLWDGRLDSHREGDRTASLLIRAMQQSATPWTEKDKTACAAFCQRCDRSSPEAGMVLWQGCSDSSAAAAAGWSWKQESVSGQQSPQLQLVRC